MRHERDPIYFGTEARPLFGWLHRSRQSAAPVLGLVICNPFGSEAIASHRSVRFFAERTADAGLPTLRFDYDGTGDSAGHDLDPDRLTAWVASARCAATEIRELTGVERVCFAGIRLGAAIAALAAAERTDVAGVVAIAPVVSGKAYLRELRMLSLAIDSKRNSTREGSEDALQTAGFLLSAQTQNGLLEIDLKRLAAAPAARVLILDRAELPGGEAWAQHLRNLGARADRVIVKGYTEMMLDSHETVIPHEIIGGALSWLGELAREQPAAERTGADATNSPASRVPKVAPDSIRLMHALPDDPVTGDTPRVAIEEAAVRFGSPPGLFGIVSAQQPERRQSSPGSRAVLLLNAGSVHHVGPNRLYVALARHLARLGHIVLRMDIAGIGDSPTCAGEPDNVVYSTYALRDVGEAIEYLQRHWGAHDVRAVGLCSGAYHALKASVARLPLTGVVIINPLTFFWKKDMSLEYPEHRIATDIVRYRTNALRLSSWLKLFGGGVNLWELIQVLVRRARTVTLEALRGPARMLGIPLRDDLPSELRRAANAAVDLQFVFAATDPGGEMLRSQGGKTAQRMLARGQLGVKLINDADHTFTDLAARTMLATLLTQILDGQAKHPQKTCSGGR